MNQLTGTQLLSYWSAPEVSVNLMVFLNILGALLLGLVVGYERSYHGRAAGMRTYGLVCMASAALTVLSGYPGYWYAGHSAEALGSDPTRVIQGIVTGIGFLGAGVIMKDGISISGLTTAASLWASSVIGILVGVGFYASAILLTGLSAACMLLVGRLEHWLPARHALSVTLRFRQGSAPDEATLRRLVKHRGYEFVSSSLTVTLTGGEAEYKFVAQALVRSATAPLANIALDLEGDEEVTFVQLSHARN